MGGVIEAVDAVLGGKVDNAYALVRPPGHHAERDTGRGFCIFGNVALAAMHALEARDIPRIAVVDWDVHHGNGTQAAFYGDPRALTISIHQDRNYPFDSGFLTERGEGAGMGYNINVPLPPGSGHEAYLATIERVVAPALRAHEPGLVLVGCGFDASVADPLGRQMCFSETYREMTRIVKSLAGELSGGRLVMAHEGGYSTAYVPGCGLAVLEELSGHRTEYQERRRDDRASHRRIQLAAASGAGDRRGRQAGRRGQAPVTGAQGERMQVLFNPKCGKCRALGAILDAKGVAWEKVDYLEGALTKAALREVLAKLGRGPAEIIRWDEKILSEKGITRASGLGDEALLDLMLAHPVIVQRPIAVAGNCAVVARPPEKVLDLL